MRIISDPFVSRNDGGDFLSRGGNNDLIGRVLMKGLRQGCRFEGYLPKYGLRRLVQHADITRTALYEPDADRLLARLL